MNRVQDQAVIITEGNSAMGAADFADGIDMVRQQKYNVYKEKRHTMPKRIL